MPLSQFDVQSNEQQMIESAPFLVDHYVDLLNKTERFLAAQGIAPNDYAVVRQAEHASGMIAVRYDETRFDDGDYHARIVIRGAGGDTVIDTGFRMALRLVRATFDSSDNLSLARRLNALQPGELARKIDPVGMARDRRSSGLFIDRKSRPYRLDNIEVHGECTTLATSPSVTALEYVVLMSDYGTRTELGQRFAAFD